MSDPVPCACDACAATAPAGASDGMCPFCATHCYPGEPGRRRILGAVVRVAMHARPDAPRGGPAFDAEAAMQQLAGRATDLARPYIEDALTAGVRALRRKLAR